MRNGVKAFFGNLFPGFPANAVCLVFDTYQCGLQVLYEFHLSLIFAGAMGNIIDSLFYGLIFSESTFYTVATFMPEGGGYAPFLYGKVVDMLYFPLFGFYWPKSMPFIGGEYFEFVHPIFNIADASISVGVIVLILFYRHTFSSSLSELFPSKSK